MEMGQITVEVFTSRAKIPVAEATVLFHQGRDIIALEISNASGQTRKIAVPTPPLEDSTLPQESPAFTSIDVYVEHPDFVSEKRVNVQIFPQTDTILPVELLPLAEDQSSLVQQDEVILSPQDL